MAKQRYEISIPAMVDGSRLCFQGPASSWTYAKTRAHTASRLFGIAAGVTTIARLTHREACRAHATLELNSTIKIPSVGYASLPRSR